MEITVETTVEFEIVCNICGNDLDATLLRDNRVVVDPCENCNEKEEA